MAVRLPVLRPLPKRRRSAHRQKSVAAPDDRLQSLLRAAPKAEPGFLAPMKCKSVSAVPKGHWMIELKLDGFRALAVKRGSKVELISRNHKFLSHRFPQLLEGLARLPWPKLTLDGEIVALDAQGRPSFQSLQDGGRAGRVVYYAFDILNFEGRALTQLPFEDRRFVLEHVLAEVPENIRLSARFDGPVYEVVRAVKVHGLEGIVCKAPGSIYEVGVRSG